jgi:hypothetical protein
MKLTPKAFEVLKNFNTINPNILIEPGNILRTINKASSLFVIAKVDCDFERMAIADLSKFLSVVSLFDDPDLEFESKFVKISSGNESVNYFFAEPSCLVVPKNKEIKMPHSNIEFDISDENVNRTFKAIGVLRATEIAFSGSEGKISVHTFNSKNNLTSDSYSCVIGETSENFLVVYNKDDLKMTRGNYKVRIHEDGISCFSNDEIQYFVAFQEKLSRFN